MQDVRWGWGSLSAVCRGGQSASTAIWESSNQKRSGQSSSRRTTSAVFVKGKKGEDILVQATKSPAVYVEKVLSIFPRRFEHISTPNGPDISGQSSISYATRISISPRRFRTQPTNQRTSVSPIPVFGSLPVRLVASTKTHEVFFLAQLAAHGVRDDSLDAVHPSRHRRPFQVRQRRVRAPGRGGWPAIPLQLASCTSVFIVKSGEFFFVSRGFPMRQGVCLRCVACPPIPTPSRGV